MAAPWPIQRNRRISARSYAKHGGRGMNLSMEGLQEAGRLVRSAANGGVNGHTTTPKSMDELFRLTDYGNAERLVARHGKDLRHCHAMKQWFCWDGMRWAPDASAEAERWAKDTVR